MQTELVNAVGQTAQQALKRRSGQVGLGRIGTVEAVYGSSGVRTVRCPLALEIRYDDHPTRSRLGLEGEGV
jgi:hypothetical protein